MHSALLLGLSMGDNKLEVDYSILL
jgi:hypothetical protein